MNKNIWYGIGLLVVSSIFFFIFSRGDDIKNYPSDGKDIIVFGDSLVEGVGASSSSKNFVSLLSKRIGRPIVNLGVSGNTTIDGLARLSELDEYDPEVVIVLLGGNDYLKKIPEEETFKNLETIIKNIEDRGAVVLLLGIRGGLLADRFDDDFKDLSSKMKTAFVPNVLDGLLFDNTLMSDSIHPNDLGYKKISDKVYPVLSKILK